MKMYLNFAESILILADLLLRTIRSHSTIVLFGCTPAFPISYHVAVARRSAGGTDVFLGSVVHLEVEVDLFRVVGE